MEEIESEIFGILNEEYLNKNGNKTDVIFEIINERVRIASELSIVSELNTDDISNITGLSAVDIKAIMG